MLVAQKTSVLTQDWESACLGPLEWDAAQLLRHAPLDARGQWPSRWGQVGLDPDLVEIFRRLRTVTALSHLVATDQKGAFYNRCVQELQLS